MAEGDNSNCLPDAALMLLEAPTLEISVAPSYRAWINSWSALSQTAPRYPCIPPAACSITTPLLVGAWRQCLHTYPHPEVAKFVMQGLTEGFRIGFNYSQSKLKSAKRNMLSARSQPTVVESYLAEEVKLRRVAGPFSPGQVPALHVSRFGVIPKSHQPNKWRLIVDLSHPPDWSVNSSISRELCSMAYVTIDDAVRQLVSVGKGALMAKIDIKSAFRLVPVHPADRHLLGMEWNGQRYIDTCLPFGLRSSPRLFNMLADLLEWILYNKGVTYVLHYLDDYFTVGGPDSAECKHNLDIIIHNCKVLGIPLAIDKVMGPVTTIEFLGISLDSMQMEARLPQEKLDRIQRAVAEWLARKSAKKREILSLLGLLQHASKVVVPGRTFTRRMFNTAAKVRELDHYTRLNREFRSDLHWWDTFLSYWNGVSFSLFANPASPQAIIQTDASGSWGCGASYDSEWFQWSWPESWGSTSIMEKELVPIVLACAEWGPQLKRKVVLFECDNMAVVSAVAKGTAKPDLVMYLLRCLWFFTAHYDMLIRIQHIPGSSNLAADHLSRNQLPKFFSCVPQASPLPTPLRPTVLQLVTTSCLDWTSPDFKKLFSFITAKV